MPNFNLCITLENVEGKLKPRFLSFGASIWDGGNKLNWELRQSLHRSSKLQRCNFGLRYNFFDTWNVLSFMSSFFQFPIFMCRLNSLALILSYLSRSISMVGYGKFFEKGFISESKFLNESTPSGQKILPKVPL